MQCPACGLPNDPSNAQCARCGTPLYGPAGHQEPGPGQPPGPGGHHQQPPGPGWQQQAAGPALTFGGQRPPTPSKAWLLAGLSVVVILLSAAGVALLVYRHGGTPPAAQQQLNPPAATTVQPTAKGSSARAQAAGLDQVLDASVKSRKKLNDSIDKVLRCAEVSRAVSDMQAVGDERRSQLATVDSAALDQLANGERLRSTLHQALTHALEADQGYLDWAKSGCNSQAGKAAFKRGQSASTKAGAAKTDFLALWNPVAGPLGLPTRTRDDI